MDTCLQIIQKLYELLGPYSYFIHTIFRWKLTSLSSMLAVVFVVVIVVVAGARVD